MRWLPLEAVVGENVDREVDRPTVEGSATPSSPRGDRGRKHDEGGDRSACGRGRPMRRPGRETGEQTDHEIRETRRSEAVDEFVFEIDIEGDARLHVTEVMRGRVEWAPRVLRKRGP